MIRRFRHIHIHLAGFGAFAAGNAFVPIHLHPKQGHAIQQGIERTQRTQPLTERSEKQHAQHDDRQQNAQFPGKQLAQCRANARIDKGKRDRTLQNPLWTEIFAKEGISDSHIIRSQYRKHAYHHDQNPIFEITQRFELPRGKLLRWNFVQQLLQPTKGT